MTPNNTTDDQLDFSGAAGDMTLKIKAAQSFLINDGTNDFLKFNQAASNGQVQFRASDAEIFSMSPLGLASRFIHKDGSNIMNYMAFGVFGILPNSGLSSLAFDNDQDTTIRSDDSGVTISLLLQNSERFSFEDGLLDMSGATGDATLKFKSGQAFILNDTSTDILTVNASGIKTISGATINEFSIDGTLAGDSDTALPTEKAVKTYVDGGTGRTREVFYPADLNGTLGDFRVRTIALNSSFNFNFFVPDDFATLTELVLVGIPSAGAAGSGKDIDLNSDYGAIGQSRTTHSESDTATTYDFTGDTDNFVEIDISGVYSALAAGDYAGLLLKHNSLGGSISYLGIRLKYTT